MNLTERTLYLYVDDDQMAGVCLDALLGSAFEIRAIGEGEEGKSLLDESRLDWVIVDFDLPDDGAAEFIKSSGKLKPNHGFALLSGETTGLVAWERLHGQTPRETQRQTINAREFLSLFPQSH